MRRVRRPKALRRAPIERPLALRCCAELRGVVPMLAPSESKTPPQTAFCRCSFPVSDGARANVRPPRCQSRPLRSIDILRFVCFVMVGWEDRFCRPHRATESSHSLPNSRAAISQRKSFGTRWPLQSKRRQLQWDCRNRRFQKVSQKFRGESRRSVLARFSGAGRKSKVR